MSVTRGDVRRPRQVTRDRSLAYSAANVRQAHGESVRRAPGGVAETTRAKSSPRVKSSAAAVSSSSAPTKPSAAAPSPAPGGVSAVQRARLLGSALRVVAERGYGEMSVARVAGGAGVSRRTFYEAFVDREDCFLALFEDALARLTERVADAYGRGDSADWAGRVRAGLTGLLVFLEEEPKLARVLVVDALRGGPRVLARRARMLEELSVVVQRDGARARGRQGGLPGLTGEGVVGAAFGMIHTRLSQRDGQGADAGSLLGLRNALVATVVLPYLGFAAARRELARPAPSMGLAAGRGMVVAPQSGAADGAVMRVDPLVDLPMRVTYRTLRVLGALAQHPGASNRVVGELAGVHDQGQISKLLARLDGLGLIENKHRARAARRDGRARRVAGEANAWCLTARGVEVERALMVRGNHDGGVG